MTTSKRKLAEAFCKLEQAASRCGLKVNETKTEYMATKKKKDRNKQVMPLLYGKRRNTYLRN